MKIRDYIEAVIPNRVLRYRLGRSSENSLLFTFDDGPSSEFTPEILNILLNNQIRAVFFIVGKFAEEYPDIVKEIYEKGHVIGNHSFSHDNREWSSLREYRADIEKCQRVLYEITGEKPRFYRPPMGLISLKSLSATALGGLKTVLWSTECHEWTRNKENDPLSIGRELLDNIKGGDIILLHDNNPKIPTILKLILPNLIRKGYDFFDGVNYI